MNGALLTHGDEVQRGFRVLGVVQGVGFRWWARRTAEELAVGGTVRNCPDGSVEVRVRGSEAAVNAFAERLRAGPPVARIRSVEAFPCEEDLPRSFEVVHWS